MFDPVNRILGPRVRRDRYSYNKDEPVTEIIGYSKADLKRDYSHRRYLKNPEKAKEATRKWTNENREKFRAMHRRYYHKNIEKERERVKKWQQANPEKLKKASQRWAKSHPERIREMQRKNYYTNIEEEREKVRRWKKANPEKAKESVRRWQQANPEKAKEAVRRWHKANPERVKELQRIWRANNPEKIEASRKRYEERLKRGEVEHRWDAPHWKRAQQYDELTLQAKVAEIEQAKKGKLKLRKRVGNTFFWEKP